MPVRLILLSMPPAPGAIGETVFSGHRAFSGTLGGCEAAARLPKGLYQRPCSLTGFDSAGPLVPYWFRARPPHQPRAHTTRPSGKLVLLPHQLHATILGAAVVGSIVRDRLGVAKTHRLQSF